MIVVRLKAVAESKDWYLNKIQKETGLDMGVLRRYWYWEEQPPNVESVHLPTLERLCELLNVEPGDLIKRISPKTLPYTESDT